MRHLILYFLIPFGLMVTGPFLFADFKKPQSLESLREKNRELRFEKEKAKFESQKCFTIKNEKIEKLEDELSGDRADHQLEPVSKDDRGPSRDMIQNTVDVHRVLRKRAIAREKTHSEFENPPKMSDIPKTNPSLSSYQLEQENKKLVSDIDKFKRDLVRCQNPPKHRRNPSKMKSLEEHKEEVGGKDNPSGSLY